jgi:site-specific recombinase XerD
VASSALELWDRAGEHGAANMASSADRLDRVRTLRSREPTGSAIESLAEQAGEYRAARRAVSTRGAYRRDWKGFQGWCAARDLAALPADPAAVALYISELAGGGLHASTINRRLAALADAHQEAGVDSPTKSAVVLEVMAGIRRTHGVAPRRQVAAAVTADVRRMVEALPSGLIGVRDRALLLVGFAGAFRRSELVALDVTDVTETDDGLVITVRRSKADQEGEGRRLGVPYGSNPVTCPVRAVRAWKAAATISAGPLWRSINRHGRMGGRLPAAAVALAVKRAAVRAGLDPGNYAGHSLRAGLATSAAAAGVRERAIMNQTGHKSLPTLRRYIREGSLFLDNAAAQVGL